MEKIGNDFYVNTLHNGKVLLKIGNEYTGMGYSGASDGVNIKGKLVDYRIQFDDAELEDSDGNIHSVIPTTLKPL